MPSKRSNLLPILIAWLKEVRIVRASYRNSYVPVLLLHSHFTTEKRVDISIYTFTKMMNKCVFLDLSIEVKYKRRSRSYYFRYSPCDAPTEDPTDSTTIDQPVITHHLATPTKPNKANGLVTPESTHISGQTRGFDPLTLLSRAAEAICSESPPTKQDNNHLNSNRLTHNTTSTQLPIQLFSSQPVVQSQPFMPSHPFLPKAFSYIQSSKNLNFEDTPRYDPRISFLSKNCTPRIIEPNTNPNATLRASPEMKWHMVSLGIEMKYERLSVKNKIVLAQAIIKTESYLEGYIRPICSA